MPQKQKSVTHMVAELENNLERCAEANMVMKRTIQLTLEALGDFRKENEQLPDAVKRLMRHNGNREKKTAKKKASKAEKTPGSDAVN